MRAGGIGWVRGVLVIRQCASPAGMCEDDFFLLDRFVARAECDRSWKDKRGDDASRELPTSLSPPLSLTINDKTVRHFVLEDGQCAFSNAAIAPFEVFGHSFQSVDHCLAYKEAGMLAVGPYRNYRLFFSCCGRQASC